MIPLHDDNPTQRIPIVTMIFIGICVTVFLYQMNLPREAAELFAFQYGAIPAIVFGQASLPENMLYLWIFGNNIEDVMGHAKFVVFYLLSGILAALSHALTDPSSQIPMVGASGAISAVLGAYLLLFPRAHVLVLLPAIGMTRVAAGIVLGMWFITQLISGGMSVGATGGGVAFFAHIGGFIAGMALIGFFKRKDVRFFSPGRSTWSS